jgi:pimeloyl-ACP methyl ester carboxylesterase
VAVAKSASGISGEFCRVRTEDGLELQGFYVEGSQKSDTRTLKSEVTGIGPRAAVLHVHGWDGNFYENRFIDYAAQTCTRLGLGFLSGNNRGHDYIADLLRPARGDYVQVGGIYEKLADCVKDIGAWLDFLTRRGVKRVVLQGHSLGATKVTHYLTKTRDPRVAGLILLSPADGLGWIRRKLGRGFPGVLRYARRLVRQGRSTELLPSRLYDSPISARTFVDAFGPRSLTGMFNMSRTDRQQFPELAAVNVPVLLAVGTIEEYFVGTAQGFVERVAACLKNCPSFTGIVIKGAPHNYLGCETRLAAVLGRWLRREAFSP